ncbi:hypothetical protein TNCV_4698271 [Trichonephila clavipes]|nr:hypothetical protein TNCV_4698271 [Trichonephila clavipes]
MEHKPRRAIDVEKHEEMCQQSYYRPALNEHFLLLHKRFQSVPNSPMTPKWSPNWPPTWSPKMMPTWLYRQDFAKFSLNRHYNDLIHLGQDKGLAYCNVLPSVLSVVISVSEPQRHSVFLGLCKNLPSSSAASERVL